MLGQIRSDYIRLVQIVSGKVRLRQVLSDYVKLTQVMTGK
jgi:hypothetical protein